MDKINHTVQAYAFFLGGRDLEMVTIRDLLEQEAPGRVFDKKLSWGARASAYRMEIEQTLAQGLTPVLVELDNDLDLDPGKVVIVDHHGKHAGADKPTSLHQVFALLDLSKMRWSRWFDLVAANDRGYIPEMIRMGASREEIMKVRAADRRAQGITEAQEQAAEQAMRNLRSYADGALTVAYLPHARTAALTDRLQPELGGPGYENLLVISPDEVNFFGNGDLIYDLDRTFPGGWIGGALPVHGFWGHSVLPPLPEDVLAWLRRQVEIAIKWV